MIKILKKDCNEFLALCKCVSKDETRHYLNFIKHEDGKLVATDGQRLAVLNTNLFIYEFTADYYEVIKATKTEIIFVESEKEIDFPRWEKVIPETEGSFTFENCRNEHTRSANIFELVRSIHESHAINLKYLAELPKDIELLVEKPIGNKAYTFKTEALTVYIMPIFKLGETN